MQPELGMDSPVPIAHLLEELSSQHQPLTLCDKKHNH